MSGEEPVLRVDDLVSVSRWDRWRAARTVAAGARDVGDACLLLEMLGLDTNLAQIRPPR